MKVCFFLGSMLVCATVAASPAAKPCGKFPGNYTVSRPLTVSEIDVFEMASVAAMRKTMPDIPKLPFAYMNVEWTYFKSRVHPRDKLVKYSTDAHSWQHLAGESGYAIIRSGCVIETLVTFRN